MKRIVVIVALMVICLFSGCTKQTEASEPDITQMKAICEFAVMDCYYHNVAKFSQENAKKNFLGIGAKDKLVWLEYEGVVTLGVDASELNMDISDSTITISMPDAKVIEARVQKESITNESFVIDKTSAKIEVTDIKLAVAEAQNDMREKAESDTAMLESAQLRAKTLLENYIVEIGEAIGVEYTIQWEEPA